MLLPRWPVPFRRDCPFRVRVTGVASHTVAVSIYVESHLRSRPGSGCDGFFPVGWFGAGSAGEVSVDADRLYTQLMMVTPHSAQHDGRIVSNTREMLHFLIYSSNRPSQETRRPIAPEESKLPVLFPYQNARRINSPHTTITGLGMKQ